MMCDLMNFMKQNYTGPVEKTWQIAAIFFFG